MNNSKSGLVGILSFLVLSAASLGILGVASRPAAADAAPTIVTIPETEVVGTVPAAPETKIDYSVWQKPAGSNARASKTAARKPAVTAPERTVVRELEQGGIFGVGTSSTQTVRCLG